MILISFAAAESIYLFVYKPLFLSPPLTVLPPNRVEQKTRSVVLRNQDPNQAISEYNLQWVRTMEKDTVKSAMLMNQYEGEIIEWNTKGERINDVLYKLRFRIKGKNNNSNGFQLSETGSQNIKVFKRVDSKEEVIELKDVRVGDNVLINETIDLTKDWNSTRTEFKITVI